MQNFEQLQTSTTNMSGICRYSIYRDSSLIWRKKVW